MTKNNLIKIYIVVLGLVFLLNGCNLFGTYSISGTLTDTIGHGIGGVKILYQGKINGTTESRSDGTFTISRAKGITTVTPTSSDWVFNPLEVQVEQKTTDLHFTGTNLFVANVRSEGNGKVTVYPEKSRYELGEKVTFTPNPEEGWLFSHWSGSVVDDVNPLILTMNSSQNLTAVFVEEDQTVTIPDSNLEEAVRAALEKPYGLITREEVQAILDLDASIRPISTLDGLEYFLNLTTLNLEVTGISNILPLAGLTKLQDINLGYNSITSITPLTNLTNLNVIKLNDNNLNNITSMFWASVKNLQQLDLSGNKITDINPIKTLSHLQSLNLAKNQIQNIAPITGITTLQELNLSSNQITDLSGLRQLVNLQVLDLQKNRITNIDELRWFWDKNLRELNLSHNQLTDLQPLAEMENLEVLTLKNAEIVDISDLSLLPIIRELDLSHNQISDLSGLANLTTLENLYLHNNQITDIQPLVNLTNLEKVTLMNNDDLNLSKGSPADQVIQQLIAMGCVVLYDYYQNDAPILEAIGPKTIHECDQLIIPLKARDPNGDQLTYRAEGDLVEHFDPATHTFDWTSGYEDAGIYTITFFVSDGDIEVSEEIIIEVINVNRPPRFIGLSDMQVDENTTLAFTLEAVDDDGQAVTFDATSDDLDLYSPPALFIPETGEFTWTPGYDDSGTYTVTFTVNDGEDTVSQTVIITVNHVNRPPVLQPIGEQRVMETETVYFEIVASDPDVEDTLSYIVTSTTESLLAYYDPDTLSFTWPTGYTDAGTYIVRVTVDDGTTTVTEDVSIIVDNSDRPPILDPIGPKSVDEYVELTFTIHATDEDGDPITYSMTPLDDATIDPQTGVFSWTPDMDDMLASPHQVTFTASANGLESSETITIAVLDVEHPPTLTPIGPQTVNENEPLQIVLDAVDLDRDALTYTATSTDLDLTGKWDPVSGTFNWTPGYDDSGIYHITFTVSDGDEQVSEDVTITVNHVNRAPILDPIGPKTIQETNVLSFSISATELDVQDTLTYWATSETPGLGNLFDSSTLTFQWPTDYEDEGVYYVTFVVSDGHVEVSEEVEITVTKRDRPPELAPIGPQSVNDNELLTFTISATDLDNDPITYSMSPILTGATLDPNTGVFEWTPTNDQIAGSPYDITFTAVTDEAIDTEVVQITVVDVNHPPVIQVTGNTTIFEGQTLDIQVTYTDVDEDVLNVEVLGTLSSYYYEDAGTGMKGFVWETGYTDHGLYWAEIRVSDGIVSEDVTYNLEVEVVDVDAAPVITPLPNVDYFRNTQTEPISFIVDAIDPDGDSLLLSAQGLPTGASFNTVTGAFSWTPDADDVGQHTLSFIATANGKQTTEQVIITVYGPKLILSNMLISTNNIELGTGGDPPVSVRVTVQNVGNQACPANTTMVWGVYDRSDQFLTTVYTVNSLGSDLAPGGSRNIILTLPDTDILPNVPSMDDLGLTVGDYRFGAEIADDKVGGPIYTGVNFTLIPQQVTLTVNISGQDGASGTILRSIDSDTYDINTPVTLTADPDEGCVFAGWEESGVTISNDTSIEITLDSDKIITAKFNRLPFTSNNRLAFISKRDNSYGEIYIMEGNGVINRITTNTITESKLSWSPDGTKIAFEGSINGNKDIYVVDVSTKALTRLTLDSGVDESPSWSPDGTQIVFASDRYGNKDIFKIDVNGSNLTQLTKHNSLNETDPIWHDDYIVFTCEGYLYRITSTGSDRTQMTIVGSPAVSRPRWSADGDKIALDGQDGDIYMINFTGPLGNLYESWDFYNFTNAAGTDNSPAWNPVTNELAFVSTRGKTTGEIYVYDINDVLSPLTSNEVDDTEPGWNSSGTLIAFTSMRDGNKEIYAYDMTNSPAVLFRLTKNDASDSSPVWCPAP